MRKYIRFTVAAYALADCINALNICGVKDFTITKEDNDLQIVILTKHLDEAVYKIKFEPEKLYEELKGELKGKE